MHLDHQENEHTHTTPEGVDQSQIHEGTTKDTVMTYYVSTTVWKRLVLYFLNVLLRCWSLLREEECFYVTCFYSFEEKSSLVVVEGSTFNFVGRRIRVFPTSSAVPVREGR